MKKLIFGLALLGVAASAPAHAWPGPGGYHGYYGGYHGYYGGYHHNFYRGGGFATGAILGGVLGLGVGSALAQPYEYSPPPPPVYVVPQYPTYQTVPVSPCPPEATYVPPGYCQYP